MKSTGDGTHDKVLTGTNYFYGFGSEVTIYFVDTIEMSDARDITWTTELEDYSYGDLDPIAIGASAGSIIYSSDIQVDYEFIELDGSAFTGDGDPPAVTFLVTLQDAIADEWVGFGFKGDKTLYNAFVFYYEEPLYILKDMRGSS